MLANTRHATHTHTHTHTLEDGNEDLEVAQLEAMDDVDETHPHHRADRFAACCVGTGEPTSAHEHKSNTAVNSILTSEVLDIILVIKSKLQCEHTA
jgi:hypothetical protein